MAEDNALRLISKILTDANIATPLERGVNLAWFPVAEHRALFAFVLDFHSRYGSVPTVVTVKDNFPTARILRVEDPLDYLLDQMVAWRRQRGVATLIQTAVSTFAAGDSEGAIQALATGITDIENDTPVQSHDVDLADDPLSRHADYLARAARGTRLLGLPTGFATIDTATAGLQAGQLVTVVATPKAGKSTLAMKIAAHVHSLGHVPLFQSFEMSNTEQRDRHDAIRARVSHSRLIRGCLEPAEETRFQRMLTSMVGEHQFVLSDAAQGLTVSAVQAKIVKYRPSLLVIDGVYLMFDEITGERNTPQALTNITRGFKFLAQRNEIPIVITTQALLWKMRGRRMTADAIGYSSSFFQDSDIILGLEFPEEEDDAARRLRVVASRNSGPADVMLEWDWETANFCESGDAA